MINKYLTCEQYLENYNKGDKTVVANLDDSGNILVKEGERWTWDDLGFTRPKYTHNYLVGPIAETLHAYEELGYTPEELKKIIEEYKKYKAVDLAIKKVREIALLPNPTKPETKPICKTVYCSPKILVERAIFNDPATIVFWKDGTKTVVKAQKGETYDPEKGLAMAFSKKMFGNEGNYYDQFTKLLPKKNDKK